MSYLHCPSCSRAYNIAAQSSCPFCPVHATLVDPTGDIVAAAESLARAMMRATPAERVAAAARMDRLALPDPQMERASERWRAGPVAEPVGGHGTMLRSIRNALEPVRVPTSPSRKLSLLTALVSIARSSIRMSIPMPIPMLAPHGHPPRILADGLRRAASGVRSRVKAFAAHYSG